MPRSRAASALSTTIAGRAHAEDHAVAAPVERQRGVLDHLVGGRGAGGQEAGADPAAAACRRSRRRRPRSRTRRQRPARIQSSASATACVVLAHAALTCVFGPRAPMSSANWEWPIESTRNRKRRSNSYGSRSSSRLERRRCGGRPRRARRVGPLVVEHPRAQRLQRGRAARARMRSAVVARRPRRRSRPGRGRRRRR